MQSHTMAIIRLKSHKCASTTWIAFFHLKLENFVAFVWFSVIQILQLCIKDYNKINKRFDFHGIFIQWTFALLMWNYYANRFETIKQVVSKWYTRSDWNEQIEWGELFGSTMSSTYYWMKCLLTTGFSVLCTFT